jgi:hypothetical protein
MRPSPAVLRPQQDKQKEVPTLREFGPRFIEGYARANKHKASGVHAKERILHNHLYPQLGCRRLDAIEDEDVQSLEARLAERCAKTVNNVLLVLSRVLRIAVKWKVIDRMPCTIELLKTAKPTPAFYEFDHYQRLVEPLRRPIFERSSLCFSGTTPACGAERCWAFAGPTSTSHANSSSLRWACGRAPDATFRDTPRLITRSHRRDRRRAGC